MQPRERSGARKKQVQRLPEPVRAGLEHVVLLSSVGAMLSLTYLLFIVLSGGLAAPLIGGSALEQVTRNLALASRIFVWCLWIVVLAALVRHYRSESAGWITILVGLGCSFALPMVVGSRIQPTTAQALAALGQSLISTFEFTGVLLLAVGLLRVAVGRMAVLTGSKKMAAALAGVPQDAAAIAIARANEKPSLMRQCWELQFCRSSLRMHCPRFLEGVSCWKRQSGCYCDPNLQAELLEGTRTTGRTQIAEELHAARDRTLTRSRRRKAKRRAPCGECPIYLEHQKHKYRVLSWLSYPAAAAVAGLSAGQIREGYRWVESELAAFLGTLQVLPHRLEDAPLEQASWLCAENASVVLIGVLLVAVILQLIELWVFRLKL